MGVFSSVFSSITKIFGAHASLKAKSKALKEAGDQSSLDQARMLDLQIELIEQGRPLREAQFKVSEEALRLFGEDILAEPGTSPTFKKGIRGLATELAPLGLTPESGAFGVAAGEALAGDIENVRRARERATRQAPETLPQAIGLFPGISEKGTDIANIALGKGLAKEAFIKDITDIGAGTFAGIGGG